MKSLLPLLLFLPALVQTKNALAQDSSSRVAITISPALFVPVSVAAQVGLQYKVSRRLSLLLEVAYPTFYPSSDYEKLAYWRTGLQLKMHSSKPSKYGKYCALQAAYLYRKLTDENDGIVHRKDGEYRYDAATIHSPVLSVVALIGKEFESHKHKFFADVFGGIGGRHLFNKYVAQNLRLTSLIRQRDSFEWLVPEEGWRFDYPLTRLYLTGGLRMGLRL